MPTENQAFIYSLKDFIPTASWADRTTASSGSSSQMIPTCRVGQWVHFEVAEMKYPLPTHLPILSADPTPRHPPNTSMHTHKPHLRIAWQRWQLRKLKIPLQTLLFIRWSFKCKPLSQLFHRDKSVGCGDNEPLTIPLRTETPVYLHLSLHTPLPLRKWGCLYLPVWFEED